MYAVFFVMELEKLLLDGKITALSQANMFPRDNYQTLQTTKRNFKKLLA